MNAVSPIPLQHLADAFGSEPLLSTERTAKLLNMSVKQLRGHCAAGNMHWVNIGLGTQRQKRMFRLSDVTEFLERQSQQARARSCQSSGVRMPRAGTMTSSSVVSGFVERRRKMISGKPNPG